MCKLSLFAAACASGQNCVALSKDSSLSSVVGLCDMGMVVGVGKAKASSYNSCILPWFSFVIRIGRRVAMDSFVRWFLWRSKWLNINMIFQKGTEVVL